MKRQSGFSLIELLTVVAIMLIVAAIAVPAVISSTQAANENSAANTLRTTVTAQNGYHNLYGIYPDTAAALGGPNAPGTGCPSIPLLTGGCFLADGIATKLDTGAISGYAFKYIKPTTADKQDWAMSATPTSSYSGRRSYFVDSTGTVTYSNSITVMTAPGTPLGQ